MLLALNVGNTNLLAGLIQNGKTASSRHPIDSIDFKKVILEITENEPEITGSIISSVNPTMTSHLINAVKEIFSLNFEPVVVNPKMNMTLDLSRYGGNVGSDRIVVCEAAFAKYSAPLIVFDFGTATTINVVDGGGRFIGGSIFPGLMTGINALANNTAQLSQIDLTPNTPLIGRNTEECIASGAIFGNAALADGMSERISELSGQTATVVITGGNSDYVIPFCRTEVIHDPNLLLEGLCMLYNLNPNKEEKL
jgi:type III pantothenate kinase